MVTKSRVLSFNIEGQKIVKDPNCDFSGLVSGTKGYYRAKFSFDHSWRDYKKIAVFRTTKEKKYIPIVQGECQVPDEITSSLLYYVSIIGVEGDKTIPTTEVAVRQYRGAGNGR